MTRERPESIEWMGRTLKKQLRDPERDQWIFSNGRPVGEFGLRLERARSGYWIACAFGAGWEATAVGPGMTAAKRACEKKILAIQLQLTALGVRVQ